MQMSCLQLGFYLASWGMFRGSSTLLLKSARHHVPVIDLIAAAPADAWKLADRQVGEHWHPLGLVRTDQLLHIMITIKIRHGCGTTFRRLIWVVLNSISHPAELFRRKALPSMSGISLTWMAGREKRLLSTHIVNTV